MIDELQLRPGRIVAVAGTAPHVAGEWCERLVRDEELEGRAALLSFSQQADAAQRTGWPQARYYTEEGETVEEFLSYNSVYEINPFEIGAKRPETKKSYRQRLERITRLLEVRNLADRPLIALSNGETRRVLFARALAKGPEVLVLDDPAAGLDARQRERLRDVVAALAKRGMSVVFAYHHADELPDCVTDWMKITKSGRAVPSSPPSARGRPRRSVVAKRSARTGDTKAPPVIEIRHLDLVVGSKTLFRDFSWTVRRGERWVLRGENGCGKTTLMALVTGDSPFAYAADIRVFGQPRETGSDLSRIRRRISVVSPEMQACSGATPEELIVEALRRKPDLLILDEPFLNLGVREARKAAKVLDAHLAANPKTAAILICHRDDETPRSFARQCRFFDIIPQS